MCAERSSEIRAKQIFDHSVESMDRKLFILPGQTDKDRVCAQASNEQVQWNGRLGVFSYHKG